MALPSFVVCICFPLIGRLSDKFNKRGTSLVIATLLSSLTQLYIILLPFSNRSTHILAPLVLNQLGYAIFITNVWPGLSNLLRFTHPDEFKDLEEDEEHENENDSDMSRSNFAIGIMSSLINVGNGVQPLILGAILDASKMKQVAKTISKSNQESLSANVLAGPDRCYLLTDVCDCTAAYA